MATAIAARDDIIDKCTRRVCAVCSRYRPVTSLIQHRFADYQQYLRHLIVPSNIDRRFITTINMEGKQYHLQPAGARTDATGDTILSICDECDRSLHSGTTPRASLVYCDTGPWPNNIPKDLTLAESITSARTGIPRFT